MTTMSEQEYKFYRDREGDVWGFDEHTVQWYYLVEDEDGSGVRWSWDGHDYLPAEYAPYQGISLSEWRTLSVKR